MTILNKFQHNKLPINKYSPRRWGCFPPSRVLPRVGLRPNQFEFSIYLYKLFNLYWPKIGLRFCFVSHSHSPSGLIPLGTTRSLPLPSWSLFPSGVHLVTSQAPHSFTSSTLRSTQLHLKPIRFQYSSRNFEMYLLWFLSLFNWLCFLL